MKRTWLNRFLIGITTVSITFGMSGCGIVVSGPEDAVSGNVVEDQENDVSEVKEVDPSAIRAQDDFYGYVNAEYLMNLEYDYGNPSAGSFDEVSDAVKAEIDGIIDSITGSDKSFEKGTEEYIIKTAYDMYVSEYRDDTYDEFAAKDVKDNLQKIMAIETIDEFLEADAYYQNRYGVSVFPGLNVSENYHNPDQYCIAYGQITDICGLGMKEISDNSFKCKTLESDITEYLKIMGLDKEEAREIGNAAAYLVLDIAWATDMEVLESTDPYGELVFISEDEAKQIFTNVSIDSLYSVYDINANPYKGWYILDKKQLQTINDICIQENVETLRSLLLCAFIQKYGSYIVSDYTPLRKNFTTEDHSQDSDEIMNKNAREHIKTAFANELSNLYIREYYSEATDKVLRSMCEDLRESYRGLISDADWLSSEGRQLLLKKLDNLVFVTGINGQQEITPYSVFAPSLYETSLNINTYTHEMYISNIGRDRNRMEAGMPMQMVNACYDPDNTITITMGIMKAPFYGEDKDYFTNLGGLGMVVAHEMGHAFDSNCLKWNQDGIFDPAWLPEEDLKILEERNQQAIHFYEDYFTVFEVYHVNGEKTLGENYADLGAMECISAICQDKKDYIKLYENFARIWAELSLESSVLGQIDDDVHSPATIRVNTVLAATDQFYEVYDVKEGDAMYIAPEDRIDRW